MATNTADNIILIGMPGSGKSTLGVQLAKYLGLNFIDTDVLIQSHQRQKLQEILNTRGYRALREIEARELLNLQLHRDLVATGGSAVYTDRAMQHLQSQGRVIYLQVALPEILRRINDEDTRGIARPESQSLEEVYRERVPLYERYAETTIDNNQPVAINLIARQLQSEKNN